MYNQLLKKVAEDVLAECGKSTLRCIMILKSVLNFTFDPEKRKY